MKVNEKVQMKVDEIGMHFVLSLKNSFSSLFQKSLLIRIWAPWIMDPES